MPDPVTQVLDIKKLVGAWLPKKLKVANGDEFKIEWHDEDEYHERRDAPFGSFRVMLIVPGRSTKSFKRESRELTDTDSFVYSAAQSTYQVESRDIQDIVSVTGTRGGVAHTFVEDVDYAIGNTPEYTLTNDAVVWLDGGDKPDVGTTFQVTYKYELIDIFFAQYSTVTIRLTIHASELRTGDRAIPAETISGATKNYAKSRLAGELWEALSGFITKQKGINLGPTLGSFVFNGATEINIMRTDKGESIAKKSIDLAWTRRQEVFDRTVTTIGSAPSPVTPG